ncbi:suppressor of cytokine signaling 6 [Contarinia nasturtii]|uniref:suppressor of cytokine signaling 6 n=1 Tax=Contarinia nasturtii TaxID=265458 RepID=UPI0012D49996|nr:suppressor of cytokine signaling 6 [Contarinia nasturtii]
MTNNDEPSDSFSDSFETNHHSYRENTTINSSTGLTTNSSKWYRLIPRCIRKFLVKQSHRRLTNKQTEHLEENTEARYPGNPLELDFNPDALYSIVDRFQNDEEVAMIRATAQMARFGWFWGPISRHAAQQRLHGTPNGSFLVRNSQINLHNFTISFRTAGKTLHYRIEFVNGYWQTFSSKHRSIVELIEDAMKKSKENVFCYVKQSSELIPPFPVRLTNPISHFGDIPSLQNMCRLVIQKSMNGRFDRMHALPLPNKLITYCKECETIYGEMPIRIG